MAQIVTSLLPDTRVRKRCLEVFVEAVIEANKYGANKWGVHVLSDRVRLLVGNLIVLTIHNQAVWMALDQLSLEESPDGRNEIEHPLDWKWGGAYTAVLSKNGYYTPSNDLQLWPRLRELHFAFIGRVAEKYRQLRSSSQARCEPDLLTYLSYELKRYVPKPIYGDEVLHLPEEVPERAALFEGSKRTVTINAYERNPKARRECIDHYGTNCIVCGFNFVEAYGEVGRGFIHIHHLRPLADIGHDYKINPVNDLRPVCPNCHAIIHKGDPPFSIEEVRHFLQDAQTPN